MLFRQHRRAGAGGENAFDAFAAAHALREFGAKNQIAQRNRTERRFIIAGAIHMAADAKYFGTRRFFRANGLVPVRALVNNRRNVGKRFDIVNHRRLAVQTDDGGKGRFHARHTQFAFERFEHRRLFAANVGARAAMHRNFQIVIRAQNLFAHVPALFCDGNRLFQNFRRARIFAANVNERVIALNRVRGKNHALDKLLWILFHDFAVFERAGFGLVGIDREITRKNIFGEKTPFQTRGETRAAAPLQARRFDRVRHLCGRHFLERLFQRVITAMPFIHVKVGNIGNVLIA
ncbi:MAG: hypothetical protein HDKAJFGB_00821 [Anaerolineae bacterium]|nr:hypothetical protein [Anaerolineae bacterium]